MKRPCWKMGESLSTGKNHNDKSDRFPVYSHTVGRHSPMGIVSSITWAKPPYAVILFFVNVVLTVFTVPAVVESLRIVLFLLLWGSIVWQTIDSIARGDFLLILTRTYWRQMHFSG
jgi:hypothetical protein